jgi:hypothetical protein
MEAVDLALRINVSSGRHDGVPCLPIMFMGNVLTTFDILITNPDPRFKFESRYKVMRDVGTATVGEEEDDIRCDHFRLLCV